RFVEAGQIADVGQEALVVQAAASRERAQIHQVRGGAGFILGLQRRAIVRRLGGVERDRDPRVLRLKRGNQRFHLGDIIYTPRSHDQVHFFLSQERDRRHGYHQRRQNSQNKQFLHGILQ